MTTYTTTSYFNPISTVNVLSINPFNGIKESIDKLNENIATIGYWINPLNWFIEANRGLNWLVNQPEMAESLMAGTIIGIWFIMAGANWPKKWLFWGWIVYWVLRGFVYRN